MKHLFTTLIIAISLTSPHLFAEETPDQLHEFLGDAHTKNSPNRTLRDWTDLHYALYTENLPAAQEALQLYPEQAFMRTQSLRLSNWGGPSKVNDGWEIFVEDYGKELGVSALEIAIAKQYEDLVLKLIELGVPVNERRKAYDAVHEQRLENFSHWQNIIKECHCTKSYLSDYAPDKTTLLDSSTPWFYTRRSYKQLDDLRCVPKQNYRTTSLLFWAIVGGNPRITAALLERGADLEDIYIRCTSERGLPPSLVIKSAIEVAQEYGREEILQLLQSPAF